MCVGRWRHRFNKEEEARIEAEAKAAYCEYKLSQLGVHPFTQTDASVGTSPSGDASGPEGITDGGNAPASPPVEPFTMIQKQVVAGRCALALLLLAVSVCR